MSSDAIHGRDVLMLRVLLAVLCLWAGAADAQTARKLLLMSAKSTFPTPGAAIDLDFANGRYFGCTLAACISLVRTSQKTDLLPSSAAGAAYNTFGNNVLAITPGLGQLPEEIRTNQLLNSTAPATQTTGALGATAHTLWVNGSGSAALSNGTATGCVGTATNGSPVTFTTTAGTCTVTVTGSLNAFQLEDGTFGTSLIVTAGATAQRQSDIETPAGALLAALTANAGTVFVTTTLVSQPTANHPRVIGRSAGGAAFQCYLDFENSKALSYTGAVALSTSNTMTLSATNKLGFAWDGSGRAIAANGIAAATDATGFSVAGLTPQIGGGDASVAQFLDGYISRLVVFNSKLSAARVTAGTQ